MIATSLLTIKLENICIFIAERIPNTAKKAVYEDLIELILLKFKCNFQLLGITTQMNPDPNGSG
jgi:hypothetical protein